MFERVHSYFHDDEFRFTIYEDQLHVLNFKQILILEDYYISFRSLNKTISVRGQDLALTKLLENEMLIRGDILQIEVNHD